MAAVAALSALLLSLNGAPAQAQDGSVPAQPSGLSTEAFYNYVDLTWDDPEDNSITHYQVLRRDRDIHDTGEFLTIESDTGSAATSYTDDTVEPEKRYVYRVVAVNDNGESKWSKLRPGRHPGGSHAYAGTNTGSHPRTYSGAYARTHTGAYAGTNSCCDTGTDARAYGGTNSCCDTRTDARTHTGAEHTCHRRAHHQRHCPGGRDADGGHLRHI